MLPHKFKTGEDVYFSAGKGALLGMAGRYRIMRQLPVEGGEVRYRIKSQAESFERVAKRQNSGEFDGSRMEVPDMSEIDFNASAELFPARGRGASRQIVTYRRFTTAAEAVRFAIEDLEPRMLAGAILEVDEHRYDQFAIRALYDSAAFPIARKR